MPSEDAPLNEEWSNLDLAQFAGLGAVFGLMLLETATADPWFAGTVLLGMMTVSLGYESGIIPHLKWEVTRRV